MNKSKVKNTDTTEAAISFFEEALKDVFTERRSVIINYMQSRILEVSEGHTSVELPQTTGNDWQEIDSLSRLRSLVGGRFQNLKDRWLAAGFPLKQDKSSRPEGHTRNEKGWIELSSWISNQGFEVRLNPEKKLVIFEIKTIK